MTYLSCSRVLWSRLRRGFPVRSSSWSLGGRFSGRVISLSSLQLRSTHWRQRRKVWILTNTHLQHMLMRSSITPYQGMHRDVLLLLSYFHLHQLHEVEHPQWISDLCIYKIFIVCDDSFLALQSMLPAKSTNYPDEQQNTEEILKINSSIKSQYHCSLLPLTASQHKTNVQVYIRLALEIQCSSNHCVQLPLLHQSLLNLKCWNNPMIFHSSLTILMHNPGYYAWKGAPCTV